MGGGDTIFALASGPGPSGVSVIRVSGPHARSVMVRFIGRPLSLRKVECVAIRSPNTNDVLDRGLAIWFEGPRSFTGEDCLEFQVHGSRAVEVAILRALGNEPSLRTADPGEFTQRAFLNGKMDLLEVEALGDLIHSETECQRQQALLGVSGNYGIRAQLWKQQLIDALSLIEASLDFSDEADVTPEISDKLATLIQSLEDTLLVARASIDRAEIVRDGYVVALAGPPNAGKSSLLNHIAGRDVAIVSEYAGTTRDLLEVKVSLKGLSVVLCDTAGIRDTNDPVELMGIARARRKMGQAHLTLWLDDTGLLDDDIDDASTIRVRTKADLRTGYGCDGYSISTVTGEGINELLAEIEARALSCVSPSEPVMLFNERQRGCVDRALMALSRCRSLDVRSQPEFIAEEFRSALYALESLTGRIDVEDILGNIFSKFCIGK